MAYYMTCNISSAVSSNLFANVKCHSEIGFSQDEIVRSRTRFVKPGFNILKYSIRAGVFACFQRNGACSTEPHYVLSQALGWIPRRLHLPELSINLSPRKRAAYSY